MQNFVAVVTLSTEDNAIFILIGTHSTQGWTATTRHGVTRHRSMKRLKAYRKSN